MHGPIAHCQAYPLSQLHHELSHLRWSFAFPVAQTARLGFDALAQVQRLTALQTAQPASAGRAEAALLVGEELDVCLGAMAEAFAENDALEEAVCGSMLETVAEAVAAIATGCVEWSSTMM